MTIFVKFSDQRGGGGGGNPHNPPPKSANEPRGERVGTKGGFVCMYICMCSKVDMYCLYSGAVAGQAGA